MEITVLSSLATKEAYLELVPDFERATGHKVATTWTGTVDIVRRLTAGEVFDLIGSSAQSIGDLIKQGTIAAGSERKMAKTGIGMGIRKGLPRPALKTGEDFKAALLAARSIGYSTGPSGVYLQGLFERLGLLDAIKAKIKQVPTGGTIAAAIASGEVDMGFQQMSELHAEGVDLVGPLPPEVQNVTVFSIALHAKAPHPEAAKALADFVTTPEAGAVMVKHGLEVA